MSAIRLLRLRVAEHNFHSLMAEMNDLLEQHVIGPVGNLVCFDISRLESAMTTFSKAKHTGKLVITFKDPSATVKVLNPATRASFDPDAAYLLVGCLGGLGRSLAAWMIERGARNLIFFSRSSADKSEVAATLKGFLETGAKPVVVQCDVTDQRALLQAVQEIASRLTVKGVIHAAMVEGVSLSTAIF